MKRWLREELQLPAENKRSFLSSYKWNKIFERYRQLRPLPKQIFCQSFLNQFHKMNMICKFFQVQAKELKYAK